MTSLGEMDRNIVIQHTPINHGPRITLREAGFTVEAVYWKPFFTSYEVVVKDGKDEKTYSGTVYKNELDQIYATFAGWNYRKEVLLDE